MATSTEYVEPPARARSWAQLRGDVAARSVSAGPQDDSGLPQGQPRGHQEGFARPEGRALSTDTMHMRLLRAGGLRPGAATRYTRRADGFARGSF